jgi:hypothetical protein
MPPSRGLRVGEAMTQVANAVVDDVVAGRLLEFADEF